ncbi:hypothetical protein Bca4012_076072 [Brassica carinata]
MCSSLMRRETEEDVSANLTSVLSEENGIEGETRKSELEKKGGRGRKRKELDWKSQQLSLQLQRPAYFICKAWIVESLSQKAKMAGTICQWLVLYVLHSLQQKN